MSSAPPLAQPIVLTRPARPKLKDRFFTGIGPDLAPISYGKSPNFDAGIYTATGYAAKLGHGLSLPMCVQLVVMLNQRTSVAITPAVALAYRF
jgi:hypothetical protein